METNTCNHRNGRFFCSLREVVMLMLEHIKSIPLLITILPNDIHLIYASVSVSDKITRPAVE